MDRTQLEKAIRERIAPILQEMGVEGCVIAGYIQTGDRRTGKFTSMFANPANIAVEDGLKPLLAFAGMWSAPPREFAAPPPPEAPAPAPGQGVDGPPGGQA
jgi:hypothetical protein